MSDDLMNNLLPPLPWITQAPTLCSLAMISSNNLFTRTSNIIRFKESRVFSQYSRAIYKFLSEIRALVSNFTTNFFVRIQKEVSKSESVKIY